MCSLSQKKIYPFPKTPSKQQEKQPGNDGGGRRGWKAPRRNRHACYKSKLFFAYFPYSTSCWEDDMSYVPLAAPATAEERFISTPAAEQHPSMTRNDTGY